MSNGLPGWGARSRFPDTPLAYSHQTLAAREIAEQCAVERFGGVQQRVIDAMLGELRRERLDVRADHRAVFVPQRFGHDGDLFAALQVLETGRVVVAEFELRGIEDVKDDEVVAEEFQGLDRL